MSRAAVAVRGVETTAKRLRIYPRRDINNATNHGNNTISSINIASNTNTTRFQSVSRGYKRLLSTTSTIRRSDHVASRCRNRNCHWSPGYSSSHNTRTLSSSTTSETSPTATPTTTVRGIPDVSSAAAAAVKAERVSQASDDHSQWTAKLAAIGASAAIASSIIGSSPYFIDHDDQSSNYRHVTNPRHQSSFYLSYHETQHTNPTMPELSGSDHHRDKQNSTISNSTDHYSVRKQTNIQKEKSKVKPSTSPLVSLSSSAQTASLDGRQQHSSSTSSSNSGSWRKWISENILPTTFSQTKEISTNDASVDQQDLSSTSSSSSTPAKGGSWKKWVHETIIQPPAALVRGITRSQKPDLEPLMIEDDHQGDYNRDINIDDTGGTTEKTSSTPEPSKSLSSTVASPQSEDSQMSATLSMSSVDSNNKPSITTNSNSINNKDRTNTPGHIIDVPMPPITAPMATSTGEPETADEEAQVSISEPSPQSTASTSWTTTSKPRPRPRMGAGGTRAPGTGPTARPAPKSTAAAAAAATLPPIIPKTRSRANTALRKHRTMKRFHEAKSCEDITSRYVWDKDAPSSKVGEGAYSQVYKATPIDDPSETVALKEISKQYTDQLNFQQEIEAMLYIQQKGGHPHLMGLHEHFETPETYLLVLDFIQGGELFDHLIEMGAYSELDASRIVRDIASALNFLHGIGIVHADLKPENVLLSTGRRGDSVIKVADFGTAVFVGDPLVDDVAVDESDDDRIGPEPCYGAPTPAYSPPESILRTAPIAPSMDMWALGVILFIMLTGCHPYDVSGESTDEEIEERIKDRRYRIPLRNRQIAGHLSPSVKDLIKKLINRDPSQRLTAYETLQHPWVRGETATTAVIAGSDKRLSHYNDLKTQMQVKFFENAIKWSDERPGDGDTTRRKVSLIERSFKELDSDQRGFLVTADIIGDDNPNKDNDMENIVESGGPQINMSDFENLLSENMKNKYYPAGHVIYREGNAGNTMYFLESGTIEVVADGTRALRTGGDFFGEGALLRSDRKRSATVKCLTPVHAYEISREYFEKYISQSSGLYLTMKEKDKIRKRNRAKTILRMQKGLDTAARPRKSKFFKKNEDGDSLFILESGKVDIEIDGKAVLSVFPGNLFGEHSVMTGWKRNCDAKCVAKEGCIAQELQGETFRELVASSPTMQQALKELQLRREFKKAVVLRTRKEFPYQHPEAAFDAADDSQSGYLTFETVAKLMRELNPDYTDDDIRDVLNALDLTESGSVSFDEMKKALIGDVRTSASM